MAIDPGFAPDPTVDAYQIEMRSGIYSWRLPLLLRGDILWKSTGGYDEWTGRADGGPFVGVPTDAVHVTFPPLTRTTAKRHWIMALLEEDLARDPDDARSAFYLAQHRRDAGDPRARDLYLRRAAMGGWEEEAWWAQYQAARLADWPARATELMDAWERRPERLEPLRDLVAELNRRGSHRAAYQLACVPVVPCSDTSFSEPGIYAWGMDFERSIAAWWVGRVDECRSLCDQLLARTDIPDDVRSATERNRALCGP
jgi:hypothetical protein